MSLIPYARRVDPPGRQWDFLATSAAWGVLAGAQHQVQHPMFNVWRYRLNFKCSGFASGGVGEGFSQALCRTCKLIGCPRTSYPGAICVA